MKPCILSQVIFIPALLVTNLTSAVEIYNKDSNRVNLYGKVSGVYHTSDKKGSKAKRIDHSNLSFGLKGETKINDHITGYGHWEHQVNLSSSENDSSRDIHTRLGYAGIKFSNAGSFDYGRNYGVVYDIGAWTDVLPDFGGDTYGVDNFMFYRGNSMATYRNKNFFGLVKGLNFAIQHQGKNNNSTEVVNYGRNVLNENGEGWGMSTTYNLGSGLEFGAAMFHSDRTHNQNGKNPRTNKIIGRNDVAKAYTGGFKYDDPNIYLAAMYTRSYNATRFGESSPNTIYGYASVANNLELVAQYKSNLGLRPSIAFISSRGNVQGYGMQDLKKYISIGATYNFNKHLSTNISYQINLMNTNGFTDAMGIKNDNLISLGLAYRF